MCYQKHCNFFIIGSKFMKFLVRIEHIQEQIYHKNYFHTNNRLFSLFVFEFFVYIGKKHMQKEINHGNNYGCFSL